VRKLGEDVADPDGRRALPCHPLRDCPRPTRRLIQSTRRDVSLEEDDSNHRSLSTRIPLFRLVLAAGGVEAACSEKPPLLGGTGRSNPSSSSGESVSLPNPLS